MAENSYILFYSINLTFIVTHLYGWLLKWFYRPKAYDEHFHELFPAQRSVGLIYLMQLFEIPYLLQIGNPEALFYVNAFSLLFYSMQMLVMCELYFFPERQHSFKDYWIVVPIIIVLIPFFLQAIGIISLPEGWRSWGFVVVSLVFAVYLWLNIRMALKIGNTWRRVNENTYADSDDFPVRFAQYIQWLPTLICVELVINFYADNPTAKAIRDVVFIFLNIWFCIFTLNPWRKVFSTREEEVFEQMQQKEQAEAVNNRLSSERYDELSSRLNDLLNQKQIFTEQHITIDILMQHLGTNATYLTEVIRRSGYQSFYDMICQHRVRHAISLIHQKPDEKLQNIASECGFSSPASMSKAFKSQGKEAPSKYKK